MIEQYLIGLLAGVVLTAVVGASVLRSRRAPLAAKQLSELEAHSKALAELQAAQQQKIAAYEQECRELQSSNQALQIELDDKREALEEVRGHLHAATEKETARLQQATRITEEASRLRSLSATFERWHEHMISLMKQNQDMHTKNDELSAIVRHVLIVSLNASIEAARAGVVGRGFAIVAGEVRSLATRSEELSKDYSQSLHRNDLTTTSTFQDIQAGGKMVSASLSSLEALAGQLHATFH